MTIKFAPSSQIYIRNAEDGVPYKIAEQTDTTSYGQISYPLEKQMQAITPVGNAVLGVPKATTKICFTQCQPVCAQKM